MRAKRDGRAIGSGPQKEITGWSLSIDEALILGVDPFVLGFCDNGGRVFDFNEGSDVVVVLDWLPAIVPGILAANAAASLAS